MLSRACQVLAIDLFLVCLAKKLDPIYPFPLTRTIMLDGDNHNGAATDLVYEVDRELLQVYPMNPLHGRVLLPSFRKNTQ